MAKVSTLSTAQSHQLVTLPGGGQISYAEYGDPEGLPIFYFHGFPGSRLEAGCFSKKAASLGFRLIGIDRPGMGYSSINKSGTILSWASDIADFANNLNIDKFSIIGHSGGAPFVAACAYAIPEKLNGAAIVSGMAPLDKPESKIGMSRQQLIANGLIKTMPWLAPLMMKLNLMMLKKPKMMEKAIQQLPDADKVILRDPEIGSALIQSSLEAFRNGVAGPAYELQILFKPWGFDLENIKFPITIWQGGLDKQAPVSHARIYANLIPNSQLRLIENEGHHSLLIKNIEDIFRSASKVK